MHVRKDEIEWARGIYTDLVYDGMFPYCAITYSIIRQHFWLGYRVW